MVIRLSVLVGPGGEDSDYKDKDDEEVESADEEDTIIGMIIITPAVFVFAVSPD